MEEELWQAVMEEEGREAKGMKLPKPPREEEVEKHNARHLPYRAWCPECVEGFPRERAHRDQRDGERAIPIVLCDYMFLTHRRGSRK